MDELSALIQRHATDSTEPAPGVLLTLVQKLTPPSDGMGFPLVVLVAQGVKRISLGDQTYEYGPGQLLIVSVDVPITGHYLEAPFAAVGLRLRPAAIADLLLEAEPTSAAPPLAVSTAPPELIDAFTRLLRLLDHPRDLPVLLPLLEREILWRLITSEHGSTIRQIGLADSNLAHISTTIRWIREHHAEPLRIDDLAALAGMSPSSFHRHFRAITTLTPIQFQKHIRLQRARALLAAQGDDVAGIGYSVGYESASQFTREYRRHFGLPPGRDAARLREGDGWASAAVL